MLRAKALSFVSHNASLLLRLSAPAFLLEIAGCVLILAVAVLLIMRWLRPSAEELERRRRQRLAVTGRITTGELLEGRTLGGDESYSPTPEVLLYSYRLAGVTYNCAQDVSELADRVRGFSVEGPVQVRYDPRNPCNSVLVSENWCGLWVTR